MPLTAKNEYNLKSMIVDVSGIGGLKVRYVRMEDL